MEEMFKKSNAKKRMKSRIQSIHKSLNISHLTAGSSNKNVFKPQRESSASKLVKAYNIKDPSLFQIKKMLPVGLNHNKENEISSKCQGLQAARANLKRIVSLIGNHCQESRDYKR